MAEACVLSLPLILHPQGLSNWSNSSVVYCTNAVVEVDGIFTFVSNVSFSELDHGDPTQDLIFCLFLTCFSSNSSYSGNTSKDIAITGHSVGASVFSLFPGKGIGRGLGIS